MTFARLKGWDWVAFAAAILLLFASSLDWYSTKQAEQARTYQDEVRDLPPTGDVPSDEEDAGYRAEEDETNAWQAGALVDRLALLLLLATVAMAIASAFLRAAGRRFEPPRTPSGITALLAAGAALVVLYRLVQKPGLDAGATIKIGAPVALLLLGVVALASAVSLRREEAGDAFRELPEPKTVPPPGGAEA